MAKQTEVDDLDNTAILSIGEVRELIYQKKKRATVTLESKVLNNEVSPHINFTIEGVIKFNTLFKDGNIATQGEIPVKVLYSDIPVKK